MKRLIAAAVPLVAAFAVAAPAQAGTYDVHFCNSSGTVFDNKSWASLAKPKTPKSIVPKSLRKANNIYKLKK